MLISLYFKGGSYAVDVFQGRSRAVESLYNLLLPLNNLSIFKLLSRHLVLIVLVGTFKLGVISKIQSPGASEVISPVTQENLGLLSRHVSRVGCYCLVHSCVICI